jgi:hypothetical protein
MAFLQSIFLIWLLDVQYAPSTEAILDQSFVAVVEKRLKLAGIRPVKAPMRIRP